MGKDSEVLFDGMVVKRRKLQKEISRYRNVSKADPTRETLLAISQIKS